MCLCVCVGGCLCVHMVLRVSWGRIMCVWGAVGVSERHFLA